MEIAKIAIGSTTGSCLSRQRIPAGIAGATVSVSFTDPVWNDLEKTVVFRCDGSRIAEFDGKTAVIPWEIVKQPGSRLYFGIWGHNPGTGLQIPLIEVYVGTLEHATNPESDPGTDPTLPIWGQLQSQIDDLQEQVSAVSGLPDVTDKDNGKTLLVENGKWTLVPSGELCGNGPSEGGGLSSTAVSLLLTILQDALFVSDQTENIRALGEALGVEAEEEPDIPDVPEMTRVNTGALGVARLGILGLGIGFE